MYSCVLYYFPRRALDDIRCSIEELQFYKETVFKSSEQYRVDIEGASDQGKKGTEIALLVFTFIVALLAIWLSANPN